MTATNDTAATHAATTAPTALAGPTDTATTATTETAATHAATTAPTALAGPTDTAEPQLAAPVRDAVALVAERLADPERVAAVASRDDNRDPIYGAVMWGPLTLANGLPGTALLYGELARADEAWRPLAHRHLAAAGRAMNSAPSRGLFSGPAALLAAAQTSAGPEGHYASLRRRLAAWVAEEQTERLRAFEERAATGAQGVDWAAYDLINGLSGTTRLLLDSAADPAESGPEVEAALTASLRHLVRLTEPVRIGGHDVPGWWVPVELQISERDGRDYPRGDLNLGMAHGIAGPLTVLCVAHRAGRTEPGTADAVRRIADWLLGWTLQDEAGPYWPARVPWEAEVAAERPRELFTRTAWCYGTPGVAAALHRAGQTLDRADWRSAAVEGLRAALRRDESKWAIEGATVCHGFAGLLRIVSRIAEAADDAELRGGCARLTDKVLQCADEQAPFGFRHLMRFPAAARSPVPHRAVDTAGMLEGAAGVALSLLPVLDEPLPWDRTLGLA
ncbi:lanthionine synthetase C family protein [Streptomyces sp. B-S-A8]|uniref:Lanthionine synthetase C family protein n=1 Tax=Streptomyces solicavernae TaxID=3043614 RepID=A0ABT6RW94_9ACTN|nr:lanthionine synthetase C family protein [Streptomyces sp. B-S-A8]MDI3388693.1 lanthionine synthetase C family protein [Streptomyces sp. B-S-A8]